MTQEEINKIKWDGHDNENPLLCSKCMGKKDRTQPKYNYPDTKVDMITVDKKILDAKYLTSTAVANNNLEGSEPVWQSQQNQK